MSCLIAAAFSCQAIVVFIVIRLILVKEGLPKARVGHQCDVTGGAHFSQPFMVRIRRPLNSSELIDQVTLCLAGCTIPIHLRGSKSMHYYNIKKIKPNVYFQKLKIIVLQIK